MGNLTVRTMLTCALLTACDGESARPDPTSGNGGAAPTSATSTAAATTDAASSVDATVTSASSGMMGEDVDGIRVKLTYLVGDDGMRARHGFRDAQLGIDCVFGETPDGMRCLPLRTAGVSAFFSDAACSTPAVLVNCDRQVDYAVATVGTGCDTTNVYREVGQEIAAIYSSSGASCDQGPVPAGSKAYALGPELPITTFARAVVE